MSLLATWQDVTRSLPKTLLTNITITNLNNYDQANKHNQSNMVT